MKKKSEWGFATKAIHIGSEPDPSTGAIMPPIFQTSTYVQFEPGKHLGYEYTRSHNPTRSRLENCLASLEGSKYCLTTSSGLSAAMLLMHLLPKNSRVLAFDDLYGGTHRLFKTIFHERHEFHFADASNTKLFIEKIKEVKPQMIWLESPTNPLLKLCDIQEISNQAKKMKALIVVDNTFLSPVFQRPIALGADIILHSMTKYLNGHSDVVGGALMFNSKNLYDKLFTLQNSIGPCPSPFDSWLVLRGLKTLSARMAIHEANAKKVANFLEKHPKVERVIYPGLKSYPQSALAKKQLLGSGGMITFYIKGGLKESKKFLKKLELFSLAESLGGVESLVDHPAIMTHASVAPEIRKRLGISDNLLRLSVGIEAIDDLLKDLDKALAY